MPVTRAPVVGVLALQGASELHRALLAGLGVEACEVRTPAELDRVDALVIPGGESTTISKLLDANLPVRAHRAPGSPTGCPPSAPVPA